LIRRIQVSTRDQQSALKGARDDEPRADAVPAEGQALHPAMDVLREQITATVRRELEEKLQHSGRTSQAPTERSRKRPSEDPRDSAGQSTLGRADDEDDGDEPGRGDARAESRPSASPEMGRALQDQISQALQPAMTEFREQMAVAVRHELDETLQRDRPRTATDAHRSANRETGDEQASSDQGSDHAADHSPSKGSDRSGEGTSQVIGSLLSKPFLEALPELLEQQGEQWLRSRLDQGIDLLFSRLVPRP